MSTPAAHAERVLVIDDSPTILKVVQMVLGKSGYEVTTALDGELGIQVAREILPDLILLDFVMPKMNGYQVCRALADVPELREIPIVLMSAKGDQVGERFVRVMGIVDYITKPFSPEAITAVVGHVIAKYRRGEAAAGGDGPAATVLPTTDPIGMLAPPRDTDPGGSGGADARSETRGERRRRQVDRMRELVLRAVTRSDAGGGPLAEQVGACLTEAALGRVLDELVPEPDLDTVDAVLEGDLAAVPLAEVLSLLAEQLQTGILAVRRDDERVLVCFRAGKVDFAGAEGLPEEHLLGRHLVEVGALSGDDLERFLEARRTGAPLPIGRGAVGGAPPDGNLPARFLGEQLVRLQHVAPSDLREALRRQTCERVYEALRWRAGRFAFTATRQLGPLAESAGLALATDGILMEGFRRVDEWHLIERAIDDFDTVFLRNEGAVAQIERARLTREELAVLELVNGKNSVRDIQRLSRMSSFEASKMLFRLLSIRLIRRRVAPVAVG